MDIPDILDHTQEKLHDQTVASMDHDQTVASMDILLHAKSKLSASNSFWDIKIQKIIQCLDMQSKHFQLQLKS